MISKLLKKAVKSERAVPLKIFKTSIKVFFSIVLREIRVLRCKSRIIKPKAISFKTKNLGKVALSKCKLIFMFYAINAGNHILPK